MAGINRALPERGGAGRQAMGEEEKKKPAAARNIKPSVKLSRQRLFSKKAEDSDKKNIFPPPGEKSLAKNPHKLKAAPSLKKKRGFGEKSEGQKLKELLKKALDDNLYLRAEFENFKRRAVEERGRLIRYEGERFIAALAGEVLDDLDRALISAEAEKSFEGLKKGLDLIQKKLAGLLSRFGVTVIDPEGKAFDPSYQEALSHTPRSKLPEGHVAETFKKAYKLHDKVIRPAQVILAKKDR